MDLAFKHLRLKNGTSDLQRTLMPVSVAENAENSMVTWNRLDDVDKPRWTVELEAYGLQALTTDYIRGLGQVHLEDVQVLILLAALFQDLPYGDDHVDCPSVSSEATMKLGDDIIQRVLCDTVHYDACYDLSCNTQYRDVSVVVTGCSDLSLLSLYSWTMLASLNLSWGTEPLTQIAASTQWAWLRWPLLPP